MQEQDWIPLNPNKRQSSTDNRSGPIVLHSVESGDQSPSVLPRPMPPHALAPPSQGGIFDSFAANHPNIASALIGALQPFSARDIQGNPQMPPALSSMPGGKSDGSIGKISGPKGLGKKASEAASGISQTVKDPQSRSEALGGLGMAVALGKLLSAVEQIKSILPPGPDTTVHGYPGPEPVPALKQLNAAPSGPIESPAGNQPAGALSAAPPATEPPPIDVEYKPTPPHKELPSGAKGKEVSSGPLRKQLAGGEASVIPAGTEQAPIQASEMLPSHYAKQPANAPMAGPAVFRGGNIGEEGGIPARGEQTVTGQRIHMAVRDEGTGRFRQLTPEERYSFLNQATVEKGTPGRTAVPVEKPAPPPKPAPKPKKGK